MKDIVRDFLQKTVGAQIEAAGDALPSESLDFLDPARVVSTRYVGVPQSQCCTADNLQFKIVNQLFQIDC